jgi:hypothetical protein
MRKNPETGRRGIVERAAQDADIEGDRRGLIRFAKYTGDVGEKLPTTPGFITIDLLHARTSSKRHYVFTGARFLPEESGVIERLFLVKYAANLHALWHANAVYAGDIGDDGTTLKPEFYAARAASLSSGRLRQRAADDGEQFKFWLWVDDVSSDGAEMRLSQRQARVLFCQMYFDLFERRLLPLVYLHVDDGYNLLLVGRTATEDMDDVIDGGGRGVGGGVGASLLDTLTDTSRSLSFELVIGCIVRFAMAAVRSTDCYRYPWSREYEQLLLERKRCFEVSLPRRRLLYSQTSTQATRSP